MPEHINTLIESITTLIPDDYFKYQIFLPNHKLSDRYGYVHVTDLVGKNAL